MAAAILQDMSLCMECQSCRVACQMHAGLPPAQAYSTVRAVDRGSYPNVQHHALRTTCYHCGDAACVKVCPTAATYKGESGLTHFTPAKCIGCGDCAEACPFHVPRLEQQKAVRCTGCQPLTAAGKPPVCVATCITGALDYGTREAMLTKAEKRVGALKGAWPNAQVYSPEGVGGTALIWVLRDRPEVYGLPADPQVAEGLGAWKAALEPAAGLQMAGGLLMAGLGWVIKGRMEGRGSR